MFTGNTLECMYKIIKWSIGKVKSSDIIFFEVSYCPLSYLVENLKIAITSA